MTYAAELAFAVDLVRRAADPGEPALRSRPGQAKLLRASRSPGLRQTIDGTIVYPG